MVQRYAVGIKLLTKSTCSLGSSGLQPQAYHDTSPSFFLKKNKIEWLKTELESSESPTISTKALNAEHFEQKSQLFQKRLMSKPERGREKNIFLLSPTIIWCSQAWSFKQPSDFDNRPALVILSVNWLRLVKCCAQRLGVARCCNRGLWLAV